MTEYVQLNTYTRYFLIAYQLSLRPVGFTTRGPKLLGRSSPTNTAKKNPSHVASLQVCLNAQIGIHTTGKLCNLPTFSLDLLVFYQCGLRHTRCTMYPSLCCITAAASKWKIM